MEPEVSVSGSREGIFQSGQPENLFKSLHLNKLRIFLRIILRVKVRRIYFKNNFNF
jgi:hypothetical protein